ncbi:MAG: hypothetical protein AAFV62_00920 [Pseudomonadota bacterium]
MAFDKLDQAFDTIPGLIEAGIVTDGEAQNGKKIALLVMRDGGTQAVRDIAAGWPSEDVEGLTENMQAYITGLADVGDLVKARKARDTKLVDENKIERAAIGLAFPSLAGDEAATATIKKHLDHLQSKGLLTKIDFAPNVAGAVAKAAAAPEAASEGTPSASAALSEPAAPAPSPAASTAPAVENGSAKPESEQEAKRGGLGFFGSGQKT